MQARLQNRLRGYCPSRLVRSSEMNNESTINALKDAIQEVEDRKRRIDADHRALVATLRYFERQEQGQQELQPSPQYESDGNSSASQSPNELRDAMYDILSTEGPLHRSFIHQRLREKGVRIPGRDPISNISAHLSNDDRFRSVGRGMWGLVNPSEDNMEIETRENNHDDTLDLPW